MNKKFVLITIVFFEVVFGTLFLASFLYQKNQQQKVLGVAKVAQIDETKVVKNIDDQLKYYWEYKPNDLITDQPSWLKKKITYSINGDGLNDTLDYATQSAENTFRIIALGDSFTFGHYVETNENWTEQLEKMFENQQPDCVSKVEVINLGMPGFDVQEIVHRYKRIGAKYEPDLVVWFESGSGFYRFNNLMQPKISECVEANAKNSPNGEAAFEEIQACWNEANEAVLKNTSDIDRGQILDSSLSDFFSHIDTSKVVFIYNEDVKDYGLNFIDGFRQKFPGFKAFFPDLMLHQDEAHLLDGHPNSLGHSRIAREVFGLLSTNGFICRTN